MTDSATIDDGGRDSLDAGPGPESVRVERVERNADGQLVVHVAGRDEPIVDAKVARYFPWSLPEAFLSLLDSDGREVVMLETLDGLDAETRDLIEAELQEKVFDPKILRVLSYKREFGISSITAETDRGEVTFQFRGRDDVRILSATRALFRDVDGNTYELPDLTQLDPASQRHLHAFF